MSTSNTFRKIVYNCKGCKFEKGIVECKINIAFFLTKILHLHLLVLSTTSYKDKSSNIFWWIYNIFKPMLRCRCCINFVIDCTGCPVFYVFIAYVGYLVSLSDHTNFKNYIIKLWKLLRRETDNSRWGLCFPVQYVIWEYS